MAGLKNDVIDQTMNEVLIKYLDRKVAKWWNARRSPEDVHLFCGWFWIRRDEEGGPFRTRSAAIRDAYYRFVVQDDVPRVWRNEVVRSGTQAAKKVRATAHSPREARAAL